MNRKLFMLIVPLLMTSFISQSQNPSNANFSVNVNRVLPVISISKGELAQAQTLLDLDKNYKASWIRSYQSVEVWTRQDGTWRKAVGEDEKLTSAQKRDMESADSGQEISIKVYYLPENTLVDNEIKEIRFSIWVNPDLEASFPGGTEALDHYLQEFAISKIPDNSFQGYDLATIKFTIDSEGHVVNPRVFWPLKNEMVDKLLLEAICNMPTWKPAVYEDGVQVSQEFVLNVGNMENCIVNTLNIRQ